MVARAVVEMAAGATAVVRVAVATEPRGEEAAIRGRRSRRNRCRRRSFGRWIPGRHRRTRRRRQNRCTSFGRRPLRSGSGRRGGGGGGRGGGSGGVVVVAALLSSSVAWPAPQAGAFCALARRMSVSLVTVLAASPRVRPRAPLLCLSVSPLASSAYARGPAFPPKSARYRTIWRR